MRTFTLKSRAFASYAGVFLLLVLVFAGFRWNFHREQLDAEITIAGLVRHEAASADSYAVAKSLNDLEGLGLIRCSHLTEVYGGEHIFFDSSPRGGCAAWPLSLLTKKKISLTSISGNDYLLDFETPLKTSEVMAELFAYLFIAALYFLYAKSLEAASAEKRFAKLIFDQSRQIAHDIRSPIAALEIALDEAAVDPNAHRALIRSATLRIKNIADGLLASKDRRVDPLVKAVKTSSLEKFIEEVLLEKRVQFKSMPELSIIATFDSSATSALVQVDPGQFCRMVSNLINNSAEAMNGNGELHVDLRLFNDEILLEISDTGPGIPDEVVRRLGEHGFSIGKNQSTSGFGLGLSHAFSCLKRWGGRIEVENEAGAKVRIFIPVVASQVAVAEKFKKLDAVLIEDDPLIHDMWHLAARCKRKSVRCVFTLDEFMNHSKSIPATTPIYVDFDLGKAQVSGKAASVKLLEMGFRRIYISTGLTGLSIDDFDGVEGVVGKTFPL